MTDTTKQIEQERAPVAADAIRVASRLQSFADRLCNDASLGEKYEGDETELRTAINMLRHFARATPVSPAQTDLSADEIVQRMATAERGTTCPMCGKNYPHDHTPLEIVIYRNGEKYGARQQELSGPDNQGDAQDARDDAGRTGREGRVGAHQHNEHRATESGVDGCAGGGDGRSDGVSDSGEVRASVATPVKPQSDLHSAIMNLPCNPPHLCTEATKFDYKRSHRDARHACAELVSAHFATTPSEGVAAPVEASEKFSDIRALLGEAYCFQSTSPAAQANINSALDLLDEIEAAQPSADQVEPKRKILPEPGSTKPEMLLYIDAINGEQVSRDDLWIVTTEVVNRAASADQVRDAALEEAARCVENYAPITGSKNYAEAIRALRTTASGEQSAGGFGGGARNSDGSFVISTGGGGARNSDGSFVISAAGGGVPGARGAGGEKGADRG